jgi:hypothetical protein
MTFEHRDGLVAWYEDQLAGRNRRIACHKERAERLSRWLSEKQQLADSLRDLTLELLAQLEQYEEELTPFHPIPVAGRADLMSGRRDVLSAAFTER